MSKNIFEFDRIQFGDAYTHDKDLFEEYKLLIRKKLEQGTIVLFKEKYIKNDEEFTEDYATFESIDSFNKWVDTKFPKK